MTHAIQDVGRTATSRSPISIIPESPRGHNYNLAKRVIDVTLTSFLLVLLSPILLAIAIAVKADSPGSVFFVQERVGAKRARDRSHAWEIRRFNVFKFRSMFRDADESVHERHLAVLANGGMAGSGTIKLQEDERVTRVGRVLRKTSLDELPQLFNVLRGEMSLVGPRPVPPYEVDRYGPDCAERFTVLPGISGLWQVRGRCALPFEAMIACDLEYASSPTIRKDLGIMVRTIPAIITRKGAG